MEVSYVHMEIRIKGSTPGLVDRTWPVKMRHKFAKMCQFLCAGTPSVYADMVSISKEEKSRPSKRVQQRENVGKGNWKRKEVGGKKMWRRRDGKVIFGMNLELGMWNMDCIISLI
jgi:hypothetical protein